MTDEPSRPSLLWTFLPIVLVIIVLSASPNFRHQQGDFLALRASPLGGDFLQEYVGGKVFASPSRDQLYDLEHVRHVQHDWNVVGFEWSEEDYFPMVYPPFYYVANSVWNSLSYIVAVRTWLLLLGLSMTATLLLLREFYLPARNSLGWISLAATFFAPLLLNFNMAQKGCVLLLILTSTYLLLSRQKSFAAGMVFGLICFKPHLGLVIGLAMLLKRDWKFCLGSGLTVVALAGGSWLLLPDLWSDYVQVVFGMTDYVETGGYLVGDSHSLWGATQLLLGNWSSESIKLTAGLVGVVVLAMLIRTVWKPVTYSSTEFGLQFAAMVIATILLSPHFYSYDLTVFLLPLLLIACSFASDWKQKKVDLALAVGLAGFFVLSGLFRQIAEASGLPLSVFWLIAMMVLLTIKTVSESASAKRPLKISASPKA